MLQMPPDDGADTSALVISLLHKPGIELALAIEAANLGMWDLNLQTQELYWSDKCRAMFGIFTKEPVSMTDFYNGLHEEDREAVAGVFARVIDPEIRADYDVEYRTVGRDDGQVRWVAAKGSAVFDEAGRGIRAIGTVIDITTRKNAEFRQDCLIELSDRLRSLDETGKITEAAAELLVRRLGVTRAGYATIDDQGRTFIECDWTDGKAKSLTGLHKFEALGEAFTAPLKRGEFLAVTDTRNHQATAFAQAAFLALDIVALLNVPLMKNNELAALLYIHDDHPRHWTFNERRLLQDIADRTWEAMERAKAIQALRRLNETLEQQIRDRTAQRDRMWRLSTDVMMTTDRHGIIQSLNPAWTASFGWTPTGLTGRSFMAFVHPDHKAATHGQLTALQISGQLQRFENRYRHQDGRYLTILWTAIPDGRYIHFSGRDITTERDQESALHAAEEALRQAQKMEAVGQLTGGIAHDFNNLLQGILGSLELVQKRLAEGNMDRIDRFLEAAVTSANRAAALTHRLLAFARRQPLDPKPVEANPLIISMEDLLCRSLGEQIAFRLDLAPRLWLTLCDPHQLESAILNLVINARDAMPGGGTLTIKTSNLSPAEAAGIAELHPGAYICIDVIDTGSGMPPSVMERAFEPFFTTKPIGQGTGLGLSMIYGFAKQSEGHASIASELGQGTAIRLYLPRYTGATLAGAEADTHLPSPTSRQSGTVLVIEDEAVVRTLVLEVLAERGYQALEAADGLSGLKLLQSARTIDLLITDIGLPGLNGRQVAEAARASRPTLKTLFMTGYAETAATAEALEDGMSIIAKPFTIETLALQIDSMMRQ